MDGGFGEDFVGMMGCAFRVVAVLCILAGVAVGVGVGWWFFG